MRRLILTVLCCLGFLTPYAYSAGTASATFLKLGIGARNVAMGETGAAENGIYAVYWNPAGLNVLENPQVAFMHASWLDGVTFQNIAYAQKLGTTGIGLSATYLSVPSIGRYDNQGFALGTDYSPRDIAVAFSFARTVSILPLGATLKYVSSTLDDASASAVALDLGVMYDLSFLTGDRTFTAGLAVQNLGTRMKFENEDFPLPTTVRLGISYLPLESLGLALDAVKALDDEVEAHAGAQYLLAVGGNTALAVRAGYKTGADGFDGLAGLTAGLGLGFGSLGLDYAFVPYGDIDNTHRISLKYGF